MHVSNHRRVRKYLDVLKAEARGKWAYIFADLAPELDAAMAAEPEQVSCPVCGGNTRLRLFPDWLDTGGGVCNKCGPQPNGFFMLALVKGYGGGDAVREVGRWLRREAFQPSVRTQPPPRSRPRLDPAQALAMIRRISASCVPIAHTAAERYLLNRGIWPGHIPDTLRFHPKLRYTSKKEHPNLRYYDGINQRYYDYYPALVAQFAKVTGETVALQRIYLTEDGQKAPVPEPKKMTSRTSYLCGCAIQLFEPGKVLGVGEGVENMLAVSCVTGMPVWPAGTAGLLEAMQIPAGVEHVVIWEDKDVSGRGQEAGEVLAERLAQLGVSHERQPPPQEILDGEKSIGWLDVLVRCGPAGFPAHWRSPRA